MNFFSLMTIIVISCISIWFVDDWTQTHALAQTVGTKWIIPHEGWSSLWRLLSVGLLAGAVIGLVCGLALSEKLTKLLTKRKSEAIDTAEKVLSAERQALAKKRSAIDAEIKKNVALLTTASQELAEKSTLAYQKEREKVLNLERKIVSMEGRMKGAQQKAARLKKAQLKSV